MALLKKKTCFYCECGKKLNYKHYYEREPISESERNQCNLDQLHFNECSLHQEVQSKEDEARRKSRKLRNDGDAVGCLRTFIGLLLVVIGLIGGIISILNGDSSFEYTWIWWIIAFIGFYIVVGFWGLLSCIFGGIIEGMGHSSQLSGLARDISYTQTKVELNNSLLDRDIFGRKL